MVVPGSIPPKLHAFVPPRPTSRSLTFGLFFPRLVTGPIAPLTLNSLLVSTSSVAPNPICIIPSSGDGGDDPSCGGSHTRNTRRKLSLKTLCPNESPRTM